MNFYILILKLKIFFNILILELQNFLKYNQNLINFINWKFEIFFNIKFISINFKNLFFLNLINLMILHSIIYKN